MQKWPLRKIGCRFLVLLMAFPLWADTNPDVVISQVYGNFIEVFNRNANPVSIAGWSVQYTFGNYDVTAPALWDAIALQGSLAPGQYYLVEIDGSNQLQPDTSGYFPLRSVYGGSGLNFEGSIALVSGATPLTAVWPSILDVADLFGYSAGSSADGSPFPGQPTNSFSFGPQAAVRLQGGCFDAHNNATDFQLAAPVPRNTKSPLAPCPATPVISANGIVSSATFAAGLVAPGELVSIFGAHLGPNAGAAGQLTADGTHVTTSLAGVTVLFDGVPAPIIFASAGQVNAVAPFALTGKSQTTVQVQFNGALSNAQTLSVAPSAPGIFTSLGTGAGQAAALNYDVSINSQDFPDPQGSIVVIYATGAGQTSPGGQDGLITTATASFLLPVTVTIGGQDATVLFAGSAPGLVAGVLQVNVRIPSGLRGRQVVILKVGTVQSAAATTVAVDFGITPPLAYFHVDVAATDIAYDAGSNRLYASIGSGAAANANSVAVIDPVSGNILNWIPTAQGPQKIALSDDGNYLYVGLHNPTLSPFDAIQRINLQTGTPDFTVQLKDIYSDQNLFLNSSLEMSDMQVLPGQPRSLAIAVAGPDSMAPVAIIDDNVRRPAVGPAATWLSAGGPGLLWGDKRAYYVNQEGVSAGPLYPVNVDTAPGAVLPAGNQLISTNGLVMTGSGGDLLAQMQSTAGSARSFVYRADTGLAYYVGSVSGYTNFLLEAFDPGSWMPAGELFFADYQVPQADQFYGTPQRLISVGPAGLATISAGFAPVPRVFIFPLSTVQPLPPVMVPPPSPVRNGIRQYAIPSNSMTVNPAGDHLYFSIPSVAPPIGNSIAPFDVSSGRFDRPVFVGSEPDAAAVSSDGQHLNVMLDGARAIVRLSLPSLAPERQFHLTDGSGLLLDGDVVLSLPSSPTSVVVGRAAAFLGHSYGVAIYDDGVQRPNITTEYVARTGAAGQGPVVDEAQLSDDGSTLYGEQGEFEGALLSRWLITPQGLQFDVSGTTFGYQVYLDLRCQHTVCLTGSGYVADTNTLKLLTQLGNYDNIGLALPDLDNNRLFLAVFTGADTDIYWYDATTYQLVGQYVIPQWGIAHSFKKVVGDQLAIANGDELILLPISLLQSQ